MIENLITRNRSVRRFHQDEAISGETLRWLVNLARLSASAANRQPLKYLLANEPARNEQIFSCLAWAAYLQDWPGPGPGERPAAYVVVLGDTAISKDFGCDQGIAVQSILLGARERGLGGCIIGAINKDQLRTSLNISQQYDILLVVALGRPQEIVAIEEIPADGDIKYWRDEQGVHHVPKRKLEEIILGNG